MRRNKLNIVLWKTPKLKLSLLSRHLKTYWEKRSISYIKRQRASTHCYVVYNLWSCAGEPWKIYQKAGQNMGMAQWAIRTINQELHTQYTTRANQKGKAWVKPAQWKQGSSTNIKINNKLPLSRIKEQQE